MTPLEIIFLVWAVMATLCAITFFLQWKDAVKYLHRVGVGNGSPVAALGMAVVIIGGFLLWKKLSDRGR